MADRDDISERTQPPTPLRLAEARRQGQVARSRELAGGVVVLAALMLVGLAGWRLLAGLSGMTAALLDGGGSSVGDLSSVWGLRARPAGCGQSSPLHPRHRLAAR